MELQLLDMIQKLRSPVGDALMCFFSSLGNAGIIWIIAAVILLAFPKTRRSGMILAVALVADVILCNGILKNLFARVRPCDVNTTIQLLIPHPKDFSFPSGHTAASFTAVTALFFAGEKKLWKPALALAVVIAFSRMYLYVHYPTDILGGILVGVCCGYIGWWSCNKLHLIQKISETIPPIKKKK